MKRYRVRASFKNYGDEGPDLLRPLGNATHTLADNLGGQQEGWFYRTKGSSRNATWREWKGPYRKSYILNRLDSWSGANGAKFQVGRKGDNGKVKDEQEVMAVTLKHVRLQSVDDGANLMADLAATQFPGKVHFFGFVCKRYNGSTDPSVGFSDHAWGDATDVVPQNGLGNDKLTDWFIRMGKAGCLADCEQILGSVNGKATSFYSPNWNAAGSAPESHEWHVHLSYDQHYGARPPCA